MCSTLCKPVVFAGASIVSYRSNGFTLLEVLVAISIFSFIALGGFRLLSTTAELTEAGQLASTNSVSYKKAVQVISSDLRSSINRPLQASIADNPDQAAFLTHRNFMLEFSRGAYGPSVGAARSNAVRVRYFLRDTQQTDSQSPEPAAGFDLIRQLSPMDGQLQGVGREQLLLQNVEMATMRFMDKNGAWHSQWPVTDATASPAGNNLERQSIADEDAIPKAVELDIQSSISIGPIVVAIRA